MNKVVMTFLDRLAERFTALAAGLLSSRIAGLHAAAQAEQQSELEDLARRYESEGKPEIAATLRQRLLGLPSANLAGEGAEQLRQLQPTIPGLPESPVSGPTGVAADLRGLPNFETSKSPKRRRTEAGTSEPNLTLPESSL